MSYYPGSPHPDDLTGQHPDQSDGVPIPGRPKSVEIDGRTFGFFVNARSPTPRDLKKLVTDRSGELKGPDVDTLRREVELWEFLQALANLKLASPSEGPAVDDHGKELSHNHFAWYVDESARDGCETIFEIIENGNRTHERYKQGQNVEKILRAWDRHAYRTIIEIFMIERPDLFGLDESKDAQYFL